MKRIIVTAVIAAILAGCTGNESSVAIREGGKISMTVTATGKSVKPHAEYREMKRQLDALCDAAFPPPPDSTGSGFTVTPLIALKEIAGTIGAIAKLPDIVGALQSRTKITVEGSCVNGSQSDDR
ncbi:MAG: lipoprotein [Bryobacterales bacterium]|nr:lipoprotein [Bryobacterales bacterium]